MTSSSALINYANQGLDTEYSQLVVHFDKGRHTIRSSMNSNPRPCFTPTLLHELKSYLQTVTEYFEALQENEESEIHYMVLSSENPDVFNLGGDLNLFRAAIQNGERDALVHYAHACIDVLYPNIISLNSPVTTISLVQGTALGGGFEAALSGNVLIAERSAQMGLPEVIFNMFPGMGAYSLLARRIGMNKAEELILSGKVFTAEELFDMGIVDVLAEDGEGEQALEKYIKQHSRTRNTRLALQKVRQRYHPVEYAELIDIIEIWVDTALNLSNRDLRMMDRLVRAQNKL
ncbi:MAG TPA: enoyl-CoA hydratase [Gammaproteobacteria bacterium]|nr:enoyl-CoA hydratase [Gammaproteobacteria bacterium]